MLFGHIDKFTLTIFRFPLRHTSCRRWTCSDRSSVPDSGFDVKLFLRSKGCAVALFTPCQTDSIHNLSPFTEIRNPQHIHYNSKSVSCSNLLRPNPYAIVPGNRITHEREGSIIVLSLSHFSTASLCCVICSHSSPCYGTYKTRGTSSTPKTTTSYIPQFSFEFARRTSFICIVLSLPFFYCSTTIDLQQICQNLSDHSVFGFPLRIGFLLTVLSCAIQYCSQ